MENQSAVLLRRLNPYCARALEAAAILCQTRAHGEVTPEHLMLKLLEQGEGDITVLARHYEWDLDSLWQDLLAHLDKLPRMLSVAPILSNDLVALIQSAWLRVVDQEEVKGVRSVHLLEALIIDPKMLCCEGAWRLFSLSPAQLARLRPLLDAQSEERPALQRPENASTAQAFAANTAQQLSSHLNPLPQQNQSTNEQFTALLDKYSQDLTAKARAGEIDPVLGRDDEISQMIDILSRRRKNNPLLVGDPGVGKTALVEGLALRIADGKVPASLAAVTLRTLDLGLLQAGAGVKGEFEQRLKKVIEAVQQSPSPVMLFIDEAHTLIGAGNQQGGSDAANLLKPALARGELRTIAATTWSEYKQYFERDAALERRFQVINVEEPDDDKACLMLRGLKSRYATHHGVHITDAAISAAVSLSRRYLTGRQLPDKAIDLLDTAAARVRMSHDVLPGPLAKIDTELNAIRLEQQALQHDYTLLPTTNMSRQQTILLRCQTLLSEQQILQQQYEKEQKLIAEIVEQRKNPPESSQLVGLQQELVTLQGEHPLLGLDVDTRAVATVIADWTGVPLSSLLKSQQTALLSLEQQLNQRVIGQHTALGQLVQRIQAAQTGLTAEQSPLGVFLLVGPSGVGKTETALALADTLFIGNKSLITLNMSEYREAHTASQLKGSPPGYVGYGQGGVLTEAVRKKPYSVILLDEVEKAHHDVVNLFYQVFDKGVMRDGEGREIDFTNTVILMTANLGSDALMSQLEQFPDTSESELHALLYPLLSDHFLPALLARFQTLIFRPLDPVALRRIVEIKLAKVVNRLQKHYALTCRIEENLYDYLVSSCLLPEAGARNIDSLLDQQILPALSKQLLEQMNSPLRVSSLTLGFDPDDGISLQFYEDSH